MSLTDPPPDTLEFGDPKPVGHFRRRNLVAGLAAVAVLGAAATGVALAADSSTPTPSGSASASPNTGTDKVPAPGERGLRHDGGPMRGGPGGMMGGPGIEGPMGALHGEFVVPKSGGGYQTLVMQRGKVSSVSASTVTVKSDDGFTATYDVPADTPVSAARDGISSIKKGDDVSLIAEQKSGNDTALQIGDLSRMQGLRDRFGPGHDRGPANGTTPPVTPTPAPTGTAKTSSYSI
jgi:hypothetical protein